MKPNLIRRVQFPEAGEGCELFIRNRAIAQLYAAYGDDYFSFVTRGLMLFNTDVMDKILATSVWREDEHVKCSLDHLDHMTMEDIQAKLLDAFSYSVEGVSWKDHLKRLVESASAKDDDNPPMTSPEDSSAGSTELPFGLESETPSSGD